MLYVHLCLKSRMVQSEMNPSVHVEDIQTFWLSRSDGKISLVRVVCVCMETIVLIILILTRLMSLQI